MNKKGLLVVSFGTSYEETRKKTIDAIEDDLKAAFPNRKFYRAWISSFIVKKLKRDKGIVIDNVSEALLRMKNDGIEDVLMQPTHVLNGAEFQELSKAVREAAGGFKSFKMGNPLLTDEEDLRDIARALKNIFEVPKEGEALVLMGHGSYCAANSIYGSLQTALDKAGMERTFIGLVEAEPGLKEIADRLAGINLKKVTLAPFLVVAGDHAVNDLAGDSEDSWKSVLSSEGYEVSCILKGLGEYPEVRKIYVKHAERAV